MTQEEKSIKITVTPKEDGCSIGISIKNLAPYEIIGLLEQTILETKLGYHKTRKDTTTCTEVEPAVPQVDAE